jgi:hypothetical protein
MMRPSSECLVKVSKCKQAYKGLLRGRRKLELAGLRYAHWAPSVAENTAAGERLPNAKRVYDALLSSGDNSAFTDAITVGGAREDLDVQMNAIRAAAPHQADLLPPPESAPCPADFQTRSEGF